MLEAWLVQVSRRDHLRPFLMDFLAVGQLCDLKTAEMSPGELIIANTVARLRTQPKMKLGALESFEKDFFVSESRVNPEYLLTFVQKLVPLCGDSYAGCKAISILCKLVSRESNRSFTDVISTLQSLHILTLREMHLEKHLLKSMKVDTGEQSFLLLKLISLADPVKIEALVPTT